MFFAYREKRSPQGQKIGIKPTKESLAQQKKQEYVTEDSFLRNFTKIFLGSLDEKMLFTFEMYDFDNDGYITAEDIRIMLSYMQFNRNVEAKNV